MYFHWIAGVSTNICCLKLTANAPENQWLVQMEDESPFLWVSTSFAGGFVLFVSGEGSFQDDMFIVHLPTCGPPKPWKMKVLHPKYMGYNPKNEGCGFPWKKPTKKNRGVSPALLRAQLAAIELFASEPSATALGTGAPKIRGKRSKWALGKTEASGMCSL